MMVILWACAWPPLFGVIWHCLFRRRPRWHGHFYDSLGSAGFGGIIAYGFPPVEPVPLGISAAYLAIAVLIWWLSCRRRKRAPKAAGAKSRALLAALVQTMRGRAKPRQVLKPVPGGVSA